MGPGSESQRDHQKASQKCEAFLISNIEQGIMTIEWSLVPGAGFAGKHLPGSNKKAPLQ